MNDQRARAAMARIERALDRLEAAQSTPDSSARERDEVERLRTAHQMLRGRVESAIGELDRLLADGHEDAA